MLPQHSPLYPDRPYEYQNYRRLSVYGHAEESTIRDLLPEPLEYVSSEFEAFVLEAPEIDGLNGYQEGGVVIRAQYEEYEGAHMLAEYVNDAGAVAAGREIWGYPKKMATVSLEEGPDAVRGTVERNDSEILQLDFQKADVDVEVPTLFPRLQTKQIPRADGSGYDVNQVVKMTFEGDSDHFDAERIESQTTGHGEVSFEPSDEDPLYQLGPTDVIGGVLTVGNFTLSTGEILADLTKEGK